MDPARVMIVPVDLIEAEQVEILRRESVKVLKVPDGSDALAAVSVFEPHLIISSNRLSDMPVAELRDLVRMNQALRQTRFLVLTEELGAEGEGGMGEGDAHLICPVVPEELARTVTLLLDLTVRRTPRAEVELLAVVECGTEEGESAKLYGNIINISESGLRLEAEEHLSSGVRGTIGFHLPGVDQPVSVAFEVRGLLDEASLHYGLEFTDIDDETRAAIRDFVQRELVRSIDTALAVP